MKQSAMVHKRPPAAGDSPTATASERSRVANINRQIAEELGVREQQVEATVALLDGGATVPFVARYRKEITGALARARAHRATAPRRWLAAPHSSPRRAARNVRGRAHPARRGTGSPASSS